MKEERTEAREFAFEPEIELIIAVYRQARLDALADEGMRRYQADVFLLAEGFDPDAIRQTWAGRSRAGRPRKVN